MTSEFGKNFCADASFLSTAAAESRLFRLIRTGVPLALVKPECDPSPGQRAASARDTSERENLDGVPVSREVEGDICELGAATA